MIYSKFHSIIDFIPSDIRYGVGNSYLEVVSHYENIENGYRLLCKEVDYSEAVELSKKIKKWLSKNKLSFGVKVIKNPLSIEVTKA